MLWFYLQIHQHWNACIRHQHIVKEWRNDVSDILFITDFPRRLMLMSRKRFLYYCFCGGNPPMTSRFPSETSRIAPVYCYMHLDIIEYISKSHSKYMCFLEKSITHCCFPWTSSESKVLMLCIAAVFLRLTELVFSLIIISHAITPITRFRSIEFVKLIVNISKQSSCVMAKCNAVSSFQKSSISWIYHSEILISETPQLATRHAITAFLSFHLKNVPMVHLNADMIYDILYWTD